VFNELFALKDFPDGLMYVQHCANGRGHNNRRMAVVDEQGRESERRNLN